MFESLKKSNTPQKIIFTIWLLLSSITTISWVTACATPYSYCQPDDTGIYSTVLVVVTLISFVLFKVWGNKEKIAS